MAVALTASYQVDSVASDTTTLTTPAFTPATNEVLILKGVTEDSAQTMGTVTATGGGITWTKRVESVVASNVYGVVWSGVVTAGGSSITVSIPRVGGVSGWHSMVLERWSGATLAATPATGSTRGTGAPTATITTAAANSVVSWLNGDWAAIAPGTPAYRSGATQDGLHDKSGANYVAYYAYQSAATAGSQTYGLTAPTGQTYDLLSIEVQAASAGPTADVSSPFTSGMTAASTRNTLGAVALAVTAAVVATATLATTAQTVTPVTAGLTAAATVTRLASTSTPVTAALTATATLTTAAAASLAGTATLTADTVRNTLADTSTPVSVALSADSTRNTLGVVSVPVTAALTATATVSGTGVNAELPVTATLTGSAVRNTTADTVTTVAGGLTAATARATVGTASVPVTATLTASTTRGESAGATSPVVAALTAAATVASAAGYRDITLTAVPLDQRWGAAELEGRWSPVPVQDRWSITPKED